MSSSSPAASRRRRPWPAPTTSSGESIVTDGPYVETKEWLGGLTIVDVPDDDRARYWTRPDRGRLSLAAGGPPDQAGQRQGLTSLTVGGRA